MPAFMITQNPSPKSQQQVHDHYLPYANILVTQQEYCKSGQQHHHIYIDTNLGYDQVVTISNDLNPPLSDKTNKIVKANSLGGSLVYLYKSAKGTHPVPILYGISPAEVKKSINRYKNGKSSDIDLQRSKTAMLDTIHKSVDINDYFERLRKEQRALIDTSLQKCIDQMKLCQLCGDYDAFYDIKQNFESLLEKKRDYYSSSEIFDLWKSLSTTYISNTNYGQIQ